MVGRAGLKAGLIGSTIMVALSVVNRLLQVAGVWVYVSCGVSLIVSAAIGVLAGYLMTPSRMPRQGAGAGAIAGLVSSFISGVVGGLILLIQTSNGMGLPGLSPEQMAQLQASGMDPNQLVLFSSICGAGIGLAAGVAVAAIGGAIFAALQPN